MAEAEVAGGRLAAVPRWGREAVRAILRARWACAPIADLPGSNPWRAAWKLAALGWVDVWDEHPEHAHATLSPWAAAELGVEIDDAGRIVFVVDRDEEGRACRHRDWEEADRWVDRPGEGGNRRPFRMPRVRGFVPLPWPDRVPDAPRDPDPDPEAESPPAIEWTLMGRVVGALKKKPRSKKSRRRKPRPSR